MKVMLMEQSAAADNNVAEQEDFWGRKALEKHWTQEQNEIYTFYNRHGGEGTTEIFSLPYDKISRI